MDQIVIVLKLVIVTIGTVKVTSNVFVASFVTVLVRVDVLSTFVLPTDVVCVIVV